MEDPAKIDISNLVDDSKLGLFQAGMFTLCGLCLVMDGFDVQAISYVAPAIIREWGIPTPALGPVFGAGPLGILAGSLLFSVLAVMKVEEKYRQAGKDKDQVPLIEFRKECRDFANHWLNIQRSEFKRLGATGEWDEPYTTMAPASVGV